MRGAASVSAGYRSWLAQPRLALLTASRARLRRISDRWRRSLQLRVIAATLMLSAIVVSVLGYVLMQHLVTELYRDKVQSSVNIVHAGLGSGAATSIEFGAKPNPTSRQDMYELAKQLASTGETPYALEITLPLGGQPVPARRLADEVWSVLGDRIAKHCADDGISPPASLPMASSCCTFLNCSSRCIRSVTSRVIPQVRTQCPSTTIPAIVLRKIFFCPSDANSRDS